MKFSTKAIHAGQESGKNLGALSPPIFMASTYAQKELGQNEGYEYSRVNNPVREAMERNIAELENGKYGIAFASGVAAIHSIISLLSSGEHAILPEDIYGGTYRLFTKIATERNIVLSWVNFENFEEVEKEIRPNTKMLYVETPSNPLLKLTDLKTAAEIATKYNLISVADNTFMTPYFQNPLDFGFDVVLHSSSKYLGGHSDLIGGIVITNRKELAEKLRFVQKAVGAIPSPFDCWLFLRSVKTLSLRMEKHNENALKIARHFKENYKDFKVYYPGLPEHPQHQLALQQMRGFGGVVSVDFGNPDKAKNFIKKTKIFALAESLGGVESMLNHSASMSHGSMPREKREKLGITESLIRISVGIEDIEDLLEDIDSALQ
jgi:cystathionine beta-lyase/cystathionine gamma-synthase